MSRRVIITGFGINCSLGNDKESVTKAIVKNDFTMTKLSNEKKYAEIQNTKFAMVSGIDGEVKTYDDLDKSEQFARMALDEALDDADLSKQKLSELGSMVSMSLATSIMGSDYIIKYLGNGGKDLKWILRSKAYLYKIAKEYNITGGCYTTSTACASGSAGIGVAYDLIKEGKADVVICGGADHLSDISIFGFQALKTLSANVCSPFDKNRDGINIGEGSAFFIIEEYEHAKKRNAKFYGQILGYGLTNDAYHITSPDPEGKGAYNSMRMALKQAGIPLSNDLYFNTHGTGTKANDSMELNAIKMLYEGKDIDANISSTKSRTGHCLGAAGSIECALTLIFMQLNYIADTYHSNTDMDEELNLNERLKRKATFKFALSNSFAFAGNNASIVIAKELV